jgi:hypothetical protein
MHRLTILLPFFALLAGPSSAQVADGTSGAAFRSIELRGGGIVTVRHGATRAVNVIGANPGRPIRTEGDRLIIDRCGRNCPRGHRITVEVVTPQLSRVAVNDGGIIAVSDGFARQSALAVSVSQGGMIDARALEADQVAAAVNEGGRILTSPRRQLSATISNGGAVTYWGEPRVTSAINGGGVVQGGDPAALRRPLGQLDPALAPPPAVAPGVPIGH